MLISEIGLNHLGDENLAMEYVRNLSAMKVDGITFQVPEDSFFQDPKNSHLKLSVECIYEAISYVKSTGKQIGIAICDLELLEKFQSHDVDFYKILSKDINNEKLINRLVNKTDKKVLFSIGTSDFDQINQLVDKICNKKDKVELIHTNFGEIDKEFLSKISALKKKYKLPVGYGTHCKNKNSVYLSLAFEPSSILFYTKFDQKGIYPDNDHAFTLSEVPDLISNIVSLKKAIGRFA